MVDYDEDRAAWLRRYRESRKDPLADKHWPTLEEMHAPGIFSSDEEVDEFVAWTYKVRREGFEDT